MRRTAARPRASSPHAAAIARYSANASSNWCGATSSTTARLRRSSSAAPGSGEGGTRIRSGRCESAVSSVAVGSAAGAWAWLSASTATSRSDRPSAAIARVPRGSSDTTRGGAADREHAIAAAQTSAIAAVFGLDSALVAGLRCGERHGERFMKASTGWLPLGPLLALAIALPCHAKNHLWKFTEFFSNVDGSIQFIEMQECCGSAVETQMASTVIESSAHTYSFPNNLVGSTAHRWLLVATQRFANLPGAPTPDYIMPERFFDPLGDTLRYRFGTDIVVLQPGALPLDGRHSIDRSLSSGALTAIVNNPINFADQTGSVTAPLGVPAATSLAWWLATGAIGAIGAGRLRRARA